MAISRSKGRRPVARSVASAVEPLEGRRLLSAGDLDPTYGTAGKASLSYTGSAEDLGKSISLMDDGRYVVGGGSYGAIVGGTLARYLSDGTLDPSFGPGGSGTVRIDIPWTYGVDDAVANNDGTVIAVGTVPTGTGVPDVPRVQRFTPAGAIDPTWNAPRAAAGITGLTRDLVGAGGGRSILVTATMAVRLNADGTLDATFGNGGKATYNLDSARKRFAAYAGAVQSDGSLVLAGEWYDLDSAMHMAGARRYTRAGLLDASFGAGLPATGTIALPGV